MKHFEYAEIPDWLIVELAREHECHMVADLWPDRERGIREKIEWPGGYNYMQIVRTPWSPRGEKNETTKKLAEHLRSIEDTLWLGTRDHVVGDLYARSYCGGVRNLLGRDAIKGDTIQIFTLVDRGVVLREMDDRFGTKEFLTEFSLKAVAGAPALRWPFPERFQAAGIEVSQ